MKTEKLNRIRKILTNKFLIALIVFSIWMTFFDSNRIIDRMKEYRNKKTKMEKNSRRRKKIRTDKENLEKFAREQNLIKRPNEDVFIIIEED